MSDKETAPRIKERAGFTRQKIYKFWQTARADFGQAHWQALVQEAIEEAFAVECTAPAPQPDWKKEALALVVLLRAKCSDEEWANMESRFAAATPQVTPCDHFWRTIAVNPRWSWFTECEKCKIGAPLELQAENYVENTEARRG